jgi:hypothetical protein
MGATDCSGNLPRLTQVQEVAGRSDFYRTLTFTQYHSNMAWLISCASEVEWPKGQLGPRQRRGAGRVLLAGTEQIFKARGTFEVKELRRPLGHGGFSFGAALAAEFGEEFFLAHAIFVPKQLQ